MSNGASAAVYYGDGSNFTGIAATSDVSTSTLNVIGVSTLTGNVNVGSAITMYASAGIVSATSYYGDGSTLTNAGITAGKAMGLAAFLG